jgi:hypothetical protein
MTVGLPTSHVLRSTIPSIIATIPVLVAQRHPPLAGLLVDDQHVATSNQFFPKTIANLPRTLWR